jgi:hypothetical protein
MSATPSFVYEPKETDLLVRFEIDNIPAEYREYYRTKRNNLFASIQGLSEMWKYYILLDKVWMREFDDLKAIPKAAGSPSGCLPVKGVDFFRAHVT